MPERLAFYIFHDDIVLAVICLGDFMDMADVRMINGSSRLGLADESLMGYRIGLKASG
jgi:hypothetical protein